MQLVKVISEATPYSALISEIASGNEDLYQKVLKPMLEQFMASAHLVDPKRERIKNVIISFEGEMLKGFPARVVITAPYNRLVTEDYIQEMLQEAGEKLIEQIKAKEIPITATVAIEVKLLDYDPLSREAAA